MILETLRKERVQTAGAERAHHAAQSCSPTSMSILTRLYSWTTADALFRNLARVGHFEECAVGRDERETARDLQLLAS